MNVTSKHLKRPQMTQNDLVKPETNTEATVKRTSNKKNFLKDGSVRETIQINVEYLDESLRNRKLYLELAMQLLLKLKQ